MAQTFTLQPPKGDKRHKEPYTTASAAEAVNLRARGWTDVESSESSDVQQKQRGDVKNKQRTTSS